MRRPRPWHYFVERAQLHVTVDRHRRSEAKRAHAPEHVSRDCRGFLGCEHRGFPAEHCLDFLVVEPRVSAHDRQHRAASHAQRQRLCDLRSPDAPSRRQRVCLAARRQLYDLEIRRGTGQERAHRLRTHREAPASVLRNVPTRRIVTR